MALFGRKKVDRVLDHIILDHIEHYQERWINLHTIQPKNDEMRRILFADTRELIGDKKLIAFQGSGLPEGAFVWSTLDDKSWYWNGKLGETSDGQFIRGTLWDWSKRDFSRRDLTNIHFRGAYKRNQWLDLRKTYFGESQMYKAYFYQCDLREVSFDRAYLANATFEYCDLRGARFHNSYLEGAIFNGADLRNTDFWGAKVYGAKINLCEGSGFGANAIRSHDRIAPPEIPTAKEKYRVEDVIAIPGETRNGFVKDIEERLRDALGLIPGETREHLLPYPPFKDKPEGMGIF